VIDVKRAEARLQRTIKNHANLKTIIVVVLRVVVVVVVLAIILCSRALLMAYCRQLALFATVLVLLYVPCCFAVFEDEAGQNDWYDHSHTHTTNDNVAALTIVATLSDSHTLSLALHRLKKNLGLVVAMTKVGVSPLFVASNQSLIASLSPDTSHICMESPS
jgi:hypothetical protein